MKGRPQGSTSRTLVVTAKGKEYLRAHGMKIPFTCEPCEDKGWLHIVNETTGEDTHVERCDDCKIFADDDDAQDQHRKDCGCGLKVRP